MKCSALPILCFLGLAITSTIAAPALADDDFRGPPFDFSDAYYRANGIDPTTLAGRPVGAAPNSVIDNRDNGPNLNNVRLLEQSAGYDQSGHPIFFSVTGLPSQASFTANSAGARARQIAETYNVYEFPRDANPQFVVFPKAQDLVADLRNGYFSNDPLGLWRINVVHFTPAALNTPAGRQALSTLAAVNGLNLDGHPVVKTVDQIEDLRSHGYVTVENPPAAGAPGIFRWFFCPVIKDPRNGAIAPDAHLVVTNDLPAATEFIDLFNCLQTTGDDQCPRSRRSDCDHDGHVSVNDIFVFLDRFFTGDSGADFDNSGQVNTQDIFDFLSAWFAGT
jgi:hypothetical protein